MCSAKYKLNRAKKKYNVKINKIKINSPKAVYVRDVNGFSRSHSVLQIKQKCKRQIKYFKRPKSHMIKYVLEHDSCLQAVLCYKDVIYMCLYKNYNHFISIFFFHMNSDVADGNFGSEFKVAVFNTLDVISVKMLPVGIQTNMWFCSKPVTSSINQLASRSVTTNRFVGSAVSTVSTVN